MATRKKSTKNDVLGISFVKKLDGISEYRLDKNGLQILLVPDTTTPVAGVMVTYRVGSRNEATGYTGATHLLEHLMFKGSENFNKDNGGTVWDILENKGARVNATTWFDRTNYYEIVPKQLLGIAVALEADRMRRAFITESDRVTEMPVVRSEFEIGENRPMEALDKQVWALAYQAHPYHHSTIGWRSDIEQVPIERLQQFYRDFYGPDNATVTIVGDFDTQETLQKIAREFGEHRASSSALPTVYTDEPTQEGERRVVVKRAGDTNMVGLAYKVPDASHADMPALLMLSLILADGKTSRLYRAFIDTSKATDVESICYQLRDPSLFITYISLAPRVRHDAVEKLAKSIFADIANKGVSSAELVRAKQSMRAYLATRRDGPYAMLSSLNEEIASNDWTRFATFPEALNKVTQKQVQAAAKKYLVDDQSTIGYFIGAKI